MSVQLNRQINKNNLSPTSHSIHATSSEIIIGTSQLDMLYSLHHFAYLSNLDCFHNVIAKNRKPNNLPDQYS